MTTRSSIVYGSYVCQVKALGTWPALITKNKQEAKQRAKPQPFKPAYILRKKER